ncbi:MAG TPA: hypothetical protein DDZ76_05530, partial [Xanthomonadales bacterium]|nr:hypothetical protein [Xanthomonadales bacterium]
LAVLTLAMIVVGETLGPSGERAAQSLAARARGADAVSASWSGLWAREGEVYLNARDVLVREAPGGIVIGAGVPRRWLSPGA